MKSRISDIRRNHEALWMDVNRSGRVRASKTVPQAQASQAAEAQMDAFLHQDAFERAFQEAEARSRAAVDPKHKWASQSPSFATCARAAEQRPLAAGRNEDLASVMKWRAWHAARAAYDRGFAYGCGPLDVAPAAVAAACMPYGGGAVAGPFYRTEHGPSARPSRAEATPRDSQFELAWRGVRAASPFASKQPGEHSALSETNASAGTSGRSMPAHAPKPAAQRSPQSAPEDKDLRGWPPRSRL